MPTLQPVCSRVFIARQAQEAKAVRLSMHSEEETNKLTTVPCTVKHDVEVTPTDLFVTCKELR